jgi:hypothetical protein
LDFFRVFAWDGHSLKEEPGGPFHVPRNQQGSGRHDIPDEDGVLYGSLNPLSAISEAIQIFRNQTLSEKDFLRNNGTTQALARYRLAPGIKLIDLNDPGVLKGLYLKPSEIATLERPRTQTLSRRLHGKKAAGFLWWSTLEASCINVTLFQSRVRPWMTLMEKIRPLSLTMKEVQDAARWMKIRLED